MLDIDVLEDSLDDHVNLAEVSVVQSRDEVSHVSLSIQLGHLLPLDTFVQKVLNLVNSSGEASRAHVLEHSGVPLVNRDLRDTSTHEASTKNTQSLAWVVWFTELVLLALCLAVEEGDKTLGFGGSDKFTKLFSFSFVSTLRSQVKTSTHSFQNLERGRVESVSLFHYFSLSHVENIVLHWTNSKGSFFSFLGKILWASVGEFHGAVPQLLGGADGDLFQVLVCVHVSGVSPGSQWVNHCVNKTNLLSFLGIEGLASEGHV